MNQNPPPTPSPIQNPVQSHIHHILSHKQHEINIARLDALRKHSFYSHLSHITAHLRQDLEQLPQDALSQEFFHHQSYHRLQRLRQTRSAESLPLQQDGKDNLFLEGFNRTTDAVLSKRIVMERLDTSHKLHLKGHYREALDVLFVLLNDIDIVFPQWDTVLEQQQQSERQSSTTTTATTTATASTTHPFSAAQTTNSNQITQSHYLIRSMHPYHDGMNKNIHHHSAQ